MTKYDTFFEKAKYSVLKEEGFYANDPDDPGGETIFGVTRRYHPACPIWIKVDDLKKKGCLKRKSFNDDDLNSIFNVYAKYRSFEEKLNKFDIIDEDLYKSLLGFSINAGVGKCLELIQSCEDHHVIIINIVKYYKDLVMRKPKMKKYIVGWLKRVRRLGGKYAVNIPID